LSRKQRHDHIHPALLRHDRHADEKGPEIILGVPIVQMHAICLHVDGPMQVQVMMARGWTTLTIDYSLLLTFVDE
jgi:hypothetical protein